MRCRTAERRLSDELDGALGPDRRARLEAHLRACPACRAYRDGLVRLRSEAGRPAERPAEYWSGFEKRLEARLDREAPGRTPIGRPFAVRRLSWAAAGFVLTAAAAVWLALLRPTPTLTAVWLPEGDLIGPLLLEAEADPELEKAVDGEIRASIEEFVPVLDADAAALAASDPLFWEGLSEAELGAIAEAMEHETGRGGPK